MLVVRIRVRTKHSSKQVCVSKIDKSDSLSQNNTWEYSSTATALIAIFAHSTVSTQIRGTVAITCVSSVFNVY